MEIHNFKWILYMTWVKGFFSPHYVSTAKKLHILKIMASGHFNASIANTE